MLNFEEDATVSPMSALGIAPASSFVPLAPSATTAGTTHRRIRVEDKSIINSKADVNQLVPFKYKWVRFSFVIAGPC